MMVPTHVIMTVLNKAHCPETGRHRRRRRSRVRSYIILSTIIIIITITVWLVDKSSETDFFPRQKEIYDNFAIIILIDTGHRSMKCQIPRPVYVNPLPTILIVLKFLSEP